jgi:hypothetical protein
MSTVLTPFGYLDEPPPSAAKIRLSDAAKSDSMSFAL